MRWPSLESLEEQREFWCVTVPVMLGDERIAMQSTVMFLPVGVHPQRSDPFQFYCASCKAYVQDWLFEAHLISDAVRIGLMTIAEATT